MDIAIVAFANSGGAYQIAVARPGYLQQLHPAILATPGHSTKLRIPWKTVSIFHGFAPFLRYFHNVYLLAQRTALSLST